MTIKRRLTGLAITIKKDFKLNRSLYLLVLPVIAYYVIFHYVPIDYTVAFTVCNPNAESMNTRIENSSIDGVVCTSRVQDTTSPEYGEVCIASAGGDASVQEYWYRGVWFDGLTYFWQDFTQPGKIRLRSYHAAKVDPHIQDHAVLCLHKTCKPGETFSAKYVMAWYYPNFEKYWPVSDDNAKKPVWLNWYATVFESAQHIAEYGAENYTRLHSAAKSFSDTIFASTLPPEVIDAATSTLSVLKSPTCLRLTDGSFYAWEGSHAREGSCEGSCQHVWNYQYALPVLFPALERSMRELDYTYSFCPDGGVKFRLRLPIGSPWFDFRSCADGQLGGIIKSYREWKICGDDEWLKKLWLRIKKSLEYTWSDKNPDKWDPDKNGVLTGRQHHTLDVEIFGANSWTSSIYLAALEACARMADAMDEHSYAEHLRSILEKGTSYVNEKLFNGEYFFHEIDLEDRKILLQFAAEDSNSADPMNRYWDAENGQIKYQIANGCSIDQVLGQWHADLCGLGDLLKPELVKKALASIYRYNYHQNMHEHFNPCRIYCLQDESGTTICEYPPECEKPLVTIPYAQETMHGFEYAAACHMIMHGLEKEGLDCVRAVRDRYNGHRRNPFNEIEAGGNYARSMSAWALVLAYQGFSIDMTQKHIGFKPLHKCPQKHLWAANTAWGKIDFQSQSVIFEVLGGEISLKTMGLAVDGKIINITLNGRPSAFDYVDGIIRFNSEITLHKGDVLLAELSV